MTDTRQALAALPPLPKKHRAMLCTKCGFSGPTEAEASPQGAPCQKCDYIAFVQEVDYTADQMRDYARAALASAPHARKPLSAEQIADIWAECSTDNDDGVNVENLARAVERAHGIG